MTDAAAGGTHSKALLELLDQVRRRDMRAGGAPQSYDLEALFDRPDVDTQVLGRIALGLLKGVASRRSQADDAASLWDLPLFHKCLRKSIVTDVNVERMLAGRRRVMLERVIQRVELGDSDIRAIYSLAAQCFNNEYVYWVSPDEECGLAELEAELTEALRAGAACRIDALAAYAMYSPLTRLEDPERMLGIMAGAQLEMDELLARQVRDSVEERAIKREIRSYELDADSVTSAVRSQYEQSPYPRWFTITLEEPGSFAEMVSRQIGEDVPFRGRTATVLVAGCGTGREPISIATKYHDVFVVAIDVSRESLAYAVRQARRYGLTNIEFVHANLLNARELGVEFDAAVASGVLHHLADPREGIRALADVVSGRGLLKISVYSRRARAGLRPFQAIFQQSREAGANALRKARNDTLRMLPPGSDRLLRFRDFFYSSGVRDLLSHAHELQFTPLELRDLLAGCGLEFRGYVNVPSEMRQAYVLRHPEDPRLADLDHLDDFESQNTNLFWSLQSFWACRA